MLADMQIRSTELIGGAEREIADAGQRLAVYSDRITDPVGGWLGQ